MGYALSSDLSQPLALAACLVALSSVLLLLFELRGRSGGRLLPLATGVLASALALLAVLRPVSVTGKTTRVGPKVLVLVDRGRRERLAGESGTRDDAAKREARELSKTEGARVTVLGFGDGTSGPILEGPPSAIRSDLDGAVKRALSDQGETPQMIVGVTDGRVEWSDDVLADLRARRIPMSFVTTATTIPRDVSVRQARVAGAAVAHQVFSLSIEIGCEGLPCEGLPVTVRELIDGGAPLELASGKADASSGIATLELPITLDRAGARLVEVAVSAPSGDTVPANDRRILELYVARERIRVLHVAGHPTYDVRALRTWLKSNASVDVVAFFILRNHTSNSNADESELALIRFPVDELFTTHLPSFDAVVLQDIDADEYKLKRHFGNLKEYVKKGGGLVMVGGPTSFTEGAYMSSNPELDLSSVLPVVLPKRTTEPQIDTQTFALHTTEEGQAAPLLQKLRSLFPDRLPEMPGTNLVHDAREGSLVLWDHPTRKTPTGKAMPILTLGEIGDGRSIALTVDGVHRLGFSEAAATIAGRGHGALWDGLLGWLMRDPRFEPAEVDLPLPCFAGEETILRVKPLPGMRGKVVVDLTKTGATKSTRSVTADIPAGGGEMRIPLGPQEAGGVIAKVSVAGATKTRRAFPCEVAGDAWADTRPDVARLRHIAKETGGQVTARAAQLSFPKAQDLHASRIERPIAPAWLWSLGAAMALGAHWFSRRRTGLL